MFIRRNDFIFFFFFSFVYNTLYKGDWHRVIILDKALGEYATKNLKRNDRIMVYGEISYKYVLIAPGRNVSRASIVIKRIQKLELKSILDESNQSHIKTRVEEG